MPRRRQPRSRWRRHRRNRRIAVSLLLLTGALALWAQTAVDPTAPAPGVPAVIVAREVRSGGILAAEDLQVTMLPADSPLQAVALEPQEVIGSATIGDLRPGEMVTTTRLVSKEAPPPGYATMPVSIDDPEVAAFLAPGMRIDIVWTPDDFTGAGPAVVAQDVRVLQVGSGNAAGPSSMTRGAVSVLLEVAEADTVRLAAATSSGSLSVLLR